MKKCMVCKTLVAHPGKPMFMRVMGDDIKFVPTIDELASSIRHIPGEFWIKNEAPGELRVSGHVVVTAVVRLPIEEMRQLENALRK